MHLLSFFFFFFFLLVSDLISASAQSLATSQPCCSIVPSFVLPLARTGQRHHGSPYCQFAAAAPADSDESTPPDNDTNHHIDNAFPDESEADQTTRILSLASKGLSIFNALNHKRIVSRDQQPTTNGRKSSSSSSSSWTRSRAMRRLSDWAFEVCDVEGTGRIDKRAFYTAMLLVHLNLAKYAGVAACHPLNRTQVDELFELADQDNTGLLNQQEFTDAIVVSCARITSRILIYWGTVLFAVPVLVRRTLYVVLPWIHPSDRSRPLIRHALLTVEWLMRHFVTLAFFSVIVPQLFSRIDSCSSRLVRQRKNPKSLWELYIGKLTTETTKEDTKDNNTRDQA